MLYLADFSVMNPSFGLLFWTTLIFIFVWLVLGRFFKNIKNALKEREHSIEEALNMAQQARNEMKQLQSKHEELAAEAREARSKIVREAEALRDKIVEAAKLKADENTRLLMEAAKTEIDNRRKEMEVSLYNEVGKISVAIAQQIMQRELDGKHEAFVMQQVEAIKKSDLKSQFN